MKLNFPIFFGALIGVLCLGAMAAGVDIHAWVAAHPDILAASGMALAGAVKTQGTDLFFVDPDTDQVMDVGCVTSIDGVDSARDQIDTTCLKNGDRTYEAGLGTPGQASFGLNTDPSDPVHVRLYELKQAGTTLNWVIGWGDGPRQPDGSINLPPTGVDSDGDFILPTGRSWLRFDGYQASFPFTFALNAVVTSAVGLQISGSQILIPKV